MPAEKGSRQYSLSLSLSPSLPVTCQPFNVECQGDGDVTLPAGWRPLGPTRVQRQRKTLSDCAPPGARLPRVSARPHFLRSRGRPTAILAVILPRPGFEHHWRRPALVSSRRALRSPARWIRGPAWMLRLRVPSEDGPAATRIKTLRGHQVLPEPSALTRHTARGSLVFEIPSSGILRVRKLAAAGFGGGWFGSRECQVAGSLVREWHKEVRRLPFPVQLTFNCLFSPHSPLKNTPP